MDTLNGGAGNDVLTGQDDAMDFLNGGQGDDTIIAGSGDYVSGGDGVDTTL